MTKPNFPTWDQAEKTQQLENLKTLNSHLIDENRKISVQNNELLEALGFYANGEKYGTGEIENDGGEIAINVINKIKGLKNFSMEG